MVGGLKRSDGTVRPASDLTASKEVSTSERVDQAQVSAEAGPSRTGAGNGNNGSPGNQDIPEPVGSPDWPSDADEDEEEDSRPVGRGREKVPSRSPPPVAAEGDGVWHDPLEEEDEDEDTEPPAKRRRDS
jgi:hypothetical protein